MAKKKAVTKKAAKKAPAPKAAFRRVKKMDDGNPAPAPVIYCSLQMGSNKPYWTSGSQYEGENANTEALSGVNDKEIFKDGYSRTAVAVYRLVEIREYSVCVDEEQARVIEIEG